MPALPEFCGGSYTAQAVVADAEVSVNLFPETNTAPGALSKTMLLPTPGLEHFATLPQGPVRGMFGQSGRMHAVGGMHLYHVASAGTVTDLGTMNFNNNIATMTTNGDGGDELLVISGDTGYVLNLTTNVLTNVVSDVTIGAMLDGFFLALDVDTSTLKISDLLDGLTWDPLQIAQRSTASDPWKSMLVVGKNIWLFGEFTSELWYNSGDSFPFAPFPGALIQQGIAATFAAAQVGNNVCWLAQNAQGMRTVVKAQGITTTKISTYAIDYKLSQMARVDDCETYAYQENGHTFLVLNFPSANTTIVWDDTEQQWHDRGDWDVVDNQFNVDRPRVHTAIYDEHLVGDRTSGAIYRMSTDIATNADGDGIRRLRRSPGLQNEQTPMRFDALRLFLEPGLGLQAGQGSDPMICLRYSDDGGKTWSNELWRSVGAQGDYKHIVEWNRLGRSRYPRVWEVSMTDPIPWRILGAWLNPPRIGGQRAA
jgi:hypothetical protein